MRYQFGDFLLDTGTGTVNGPEGPVVLRRQTFRLLEVLLQHAPELLDRDALLDEAWGHDALSPNVLSQAISELRQALGDQAQSPRYIATVHRRGYRMVCPVHEVAKASVPRSGRLLPAVVAASLVVLLGTVAVLRHHGAETEMTTSAPASHQARSVVALGLFPTDEHLPAWIAPAALEVLTGVLARDERVLVLRGETLGVAAMPTGSRWQHAMRDLLGAPMAITGHWRAAEDDRLRLDLNLIDLDSGRLLHSGQYVNSVDEFDVLLTRAGNELRAALELPAASAAAGWHSLDTSQRRAYWRALASLNRGHAEPASTDLYALYQAMHEPAWLAPETARALRLAGRRQAAMAVLKSAMDSSEVLQGLGASLRLRAELARLEHSPADLVAALRALAALFPEETDLLLELAEAELDHLDGTAVGRTMVRLEQHPLMRRNPRYTLLQARLASLAGNLEQASALAESALADAEHHDIPKLAARAVLTLADIELARGGIRPAAELLANGKMQWGARLPPQQQFELHTREIAARRMLGELGTALQQLDELEALDIPPPLPLRALVERALIYSEKGRFELAEVTLAGIEAKAGADIDPELAVALFSARGRVAAEQGRAGQAREDFENALRIARATGRGHPVAGLQVNAGLMLARQRRFEEADRLWEEALVVFEQIGDLRGQALCLSNLAASAAARGLEERSQELNEPALALFRRLDMVSHVARTSYNMALVAARKGEFLRAEQLFDEAGEHYLNAEAYSLALAAGARRADLMVALGQLDAASELIDDLARYLPQAETLHRADWYAARARWARWSGNADQARLDWIRAGELQRQAQSLPWLTHSELNLLHVELLGGADPAAIQLQAERKLQDLVEIDQPRLRARALALITESLLMQGRAPEARIQLREAHAALAAMPDALLQADLDWLEAWSAEALQRRERLEYLAERLERLGLETRLNMVRMSLHSQTAPSEPGARTPLVPAYALAGAN